MSDTVKLHYTEAGQGMPLLLLHGFPLSSVIWSKPQRALRDLFRVITPDLRGHGQSPAPSEGYSMESLAEDVLALLDDLQIPKAVILGHSLGGYVTLAAWRLAPQRFYALGLVDSQAVADTAEGRQGRVNLANKVAVEGAAAVAAGMLPKLFAPGVADSHPLVGQVREIILSTPTAGIIGTLQGMAQRTDATDTLPTISVPTLILTGDSDQLIVPEKARDMAAAVPHAMLAVIENSGHLPMLERPEATTAALRKFLGTVAD